MSFHAYLHTKSDFFGSLLIFFSFPRQRKKKMDSICSSFDSSPPGYVRYGYAMEAPSDAQVNDVRQQVTLSGGTNFNTASQGQVVIFTWFA